MPYLILGIALLAGFLLAGRWFISAEPKILLKALKWILIGSIVAIAVFFLFTGRIAWAVAAIPALLPWLIRARGIVRAAKAFHRMSPRRGKRESGRTSTVNTRYLRMELDHDSGVMRGRVVEGTYAGRTLHDLTIGDILRLLAECQVEDPESTPILESYLDRERPEWRSQSSTGQQGPGGTDGGQTHNHRPVDMSRAEAYRILGLEEGASDDVVRDAHRRLIAHLHPDRGGSTFLAAKVNQAKDVLLDN